MNVWVWLPVATFVLGWGLGIVYLRQITNYEDEYGDWSLRLWLKDLGEAILQLIKSHQWRLTELRNARWPERLSEATQSNRDQAFFNSLKSNSPRHALNTEFSEPRHLLTELPKEKTSENSVQLEKPAEESKGWPYL